ncbi:hypothetical protein GmHk_18G052368 [Glycine max]|nr:hypothetical protein GmHk_18G052368 [Glycine max]
MVSPQGRNTWTVDDLVPYVEKITILSEEQEIIIEPVAHGPSSERRFPPQEFHMLQSSVDLRHEFSAEAEQLEAGRHRGRRNPDRQARRWDRPCGTSSRHHGYHNE